MFSPFLVVLGVAVLSMALRTYRHAALQKLGALGVFATSFLTGWFVSDRNAWVGLLFASSWLLLPWLEILTRIRRLRLPQEKNLLPKNPPRPEIFPDLRDITDEIEAEGFEFLDDTGWDWDDSRQFFRLFYKSADRAQAAICLIEQQGMAFYYLSISSREKNGTVWTTWNYPFSYSLKPAPQLKINRARGDRTFLQIAESHKNFLRENRVETALLEDLTPEQIHLEIQKDLRAQIAHNIEKGVLTQAGEGSIRYSWRGLFFLWVQFLRDLVKLS
jgi:hypothetical protein